MRYDRTVSIQRGIVVPEFATKIYSTMEKAVTTSAFLGQGHTLDSIKIIKCMMWWDIQHLENTNVNTKVFQELNAKQGLRE